MKDETQFVGQSSIRWGDISARRPLFAFGYTPLRVSRLTRPVPSVVMLICRDETNTLRFLVDPEVRNLFQDEDLEYFDSLVWDFLERAQTYSGELLTQLYELGNFGPLTKREVDVDFPDLSILCSLTASFVEL